VYFKKNSSRLFNSVSDENVKVRRREKTVFIAFLYIKSHAGYVTNKLKIFQDHTVVGIGYMYMYSDNNNGRTFNNISVILLRSVLFEEEPGVPGENHRPVGSH
jgi:hypothetical protein